MKKIPILFFLSLMSFSGFTQSPEDSTRFSLILNFYNHADLVYNGTVSYHITNDYVGVSRRNLFSKEEAALYSANIRKAVSDSILALRLDTLGLYYHNPCIMSTGGNEYFISIQKAGTEKRIYLHHYYHPQIGRLINTINAIVPEENRLNYVSENTKQDCK